MDGSRRRTLMADSVKPPAAAAGTTAAPPAEAPHVLDTGVATLFAVLARQVSEDGTACPAALMLSHLHRSRGAIQLDLPTLREFLRTALHVSPALLLRTLQLSLPAALITCEKDLTNDERRYLVREAADAVVRTSLRAAPVGATAPAAVRIEAAINELPTLEYLQTAKLEFNPISMRLVEETKGPDDNDASRARSVTLSLVYQAARSRLALALCALRKHGGAALEAIDAVMEVPAAGDAAALRSENEDVLTGRSALRRLVEDLEWLARPLPGPEGQGVLAGAPSPLLRLTVVDHTTSRVTLDIARRFGMSMDLPPHVALRCVCPKRCPGSSLAAVPPVAQLAESGDVDATDRCDFGDWENPLPSILVLLPCELRLAALQIGIIASTLTAPPTATKPALFDVAQLDGPLITVPDPIGSTAPFEVFEHPAARAFRSVATALLTQLTAHTAVPGDASEAAPLIPHVVGANVVGLACFRARDALAAALAEESVQGASAPWRPALRQPLLPLVARLTRELVRDRPAAPGGERVLPGHLVAVSPLVELSAEGIAADAGPAAEAIARTCAVLDVAPDYVVTPAGGLQPTPATTAATATPQTTKGSPDGRQSPRAAAAAETPGTPEDDEDRAAAAEAALLAEQRHWAAVGQLLGSERGVELWRALLSESPALNALLAAMGAPLQPAVPWLLGPDELGAAAADSAARGPSPIRPGEALTLASWAADVDALRQAAAEAEQKQQQQQQQQAAQATKAAGRR